MILPIIGMMILAYVLFLTVSAVAVDPRKEYDRDSAFYRSLLNFNTAWVLKCARVRIRAQGLDLIPEGSRFLLVSNHRSKFDPIITWYVLRKHRIAFISKPENFSVPWFGRIIRRCCFLPIQRDDIAASMDAFRKASQLLRNDAVSVGVTPRGRGAAGRAYCLFTARYSSSPYRRRSLSW